MPMNCSASVAPPTTRMYTSEIGRSTFQPSDMSWSYRKRGNVHRTQMNTNTKKRIFVQKNRNVTSVLRKVCGAALSQIVNGMSQPPKKSVAISALAVMMFAYSAMKNIENFI